MFIMRLSEEIEAVRFLALAGKPTDEELEAYLAFEAKRMRSLQAQGVVVVLQIEQVWSAKQRRRMREFEMEYAAKADTQQLGMAMVVPNGLIRGAFTAYLWLSPPDYPTTTVPTATAAYPFVADCLHDAGLAAPTQEEFELVATAEWPGHVVRPEGELVPLAS